MPDASTEYVRLLLMSLREEQDVVVARSRTRLIAQSLGLSNQEQVRVATAVSEIARNAFRYAREGTVEFSFSTSKQGIQGRELESLNIFVRDKGPGIENLPEILAGRYQSRSGLGMGIAGVHRLMDGVDIKTRPEGTTVRLSKKLPAGRRFTTADLEGISEKLARRFPVSAYEEVAAQNQELVAALSDLETEREHVVAINRELSETNRGVVALYDELDTVYRVSRVVATKLDLDSLLQAIIDATTDVSGAEFGAFFCEETQGHRFMCQRVAGPLGVKVQSFSPATLDELIGGEAHQSDVLRIDDIAEAGVPNPLGDSVPLRSYLSVAVRDPAGQLVGALVFGHAIPSAFTERTERILTSVAVQAAIGLENAHLYRDVQAASAAKDQFLAVLSHELRTPLTPVFAVLAAMESNDALPDQFRPDLLIMRRNLQLEARLIDDLLDLTRIVKGKVPLHRDVIDLHELVRAARQTCDAAIRQKKVDVELHLNAPRHHVCGDSARLQQVLWNLLNNAVKFTPSEGVIRVDSDVNRDREIRIRVADNGRGIEEAVLEKIFHPFEQADARIQSQFGGLGLGLAISKSIVDAHGGAIRAESDGVGHGATFTFTLPLADAPATRVKPTTAKAPIRSLELRILLVDDHEDTRETLQRLLSRRGHDVVTAGSCHQALETAGKAEFDLVISDLGLPDGSGHELMPKLSQMGLTTGIALSGFGMEADVERSHEAGFFAHLTKPLDFAVLEATIEKAIDSR